MADYAGLSSVGSAHPPGRQAGLQRYYATLREHKWLIVACTALALAAAAAYVAVAKRSYTAQAELLVNPASPQDTVVFALPVLHSTGDPTRDVVTAASLVTTPQVAHAAIKALHLHTTTSQVLGRIQANPLAQSNIVAVQAVAPSAAQAQRLANAFATQTISVRTAALRAALAGVIPTLRNRVATLPANQRNGPGSLGDQLSQLEQLQSAPDPTLAVAAPAEPPSGPSSPRTKLSLIAGLFAGLVLGIAAAFAFTALDPRLQREEQLGEVFPGVPVLARIPRVKTRRKPRPLVPKELPIAAGEQYRTLRAFLTTRSLGQPQAYMLTGSVSSEGKTTSAINLAAALAQGGGRVILIEADLRRPTIARVLGLTMHYGAEQVLIGEIELSDALEQVRVGGTPFHVLAASSSGVQLANRLSFAVARRLVDRAKELADFVVIDSPPLTAVIDALPLAQLVDELLVVVRVGHSRLNKLLNLELLLSQQGASPTGLVLVGVPASEFGHEYYTEEPDRPRSARAQRRLAAEEAAPERGSLT